MCHSFKFFFMFFFMSFFAHSQIAIRGTVKDSSNVVIEFANVVLTNQANEIITGIITDENGSFKLSVKEGDYNLTISFIGYEDWTKNVSVSKNQDFGIIILDEDKNKLREITIIAKKPIMVQEVDRLVFNVEHSISSIGGNALDALSVTPNIRLKNNQILMIGKDGLGVMVNDRIINLAGEDLMNFIKTIPSESIKSIEVITTPPAKYSAEGNSGLINIKLKKEKNDNWNVSLNSSYKQSSFPTGRFGGSFNYRKNKLRFYTNITFSDGSKKGTDVENIIYSTQKWNNNFKEKAHRADFSSRIGLDYMLSKYWSLGTQYLGNFNNRKSDQKTKTTIENTATNLIDSLLNTESFNTREAALNSFNFHLINKLDTIGKKISFDFDFLNYDRNNDRDYKTQNTDSQLNKTTNGFKSAKNYGIQDIDIYSAKIDVDFPLKWISLTFGGKIYLSETKYDTHFYDTTTGQSILNINQSNAFNYKENTQAIYLSGTKKFSSKWIAQFGLRIENTQTEGNSITLNRINKNDYIEFFPTAYLLYKKNENTNFSLNYSRRLSRPRYNELNPFKVFYSPFSFTKGNPFLSPSFTNNFTFRHTYKHTLFSSISYSFKIKGRGNPPFFDEDTKIQSLIDLNYYSSQTYRFSENYILKKSNWWESVFQGNLFYTKTQVTKDLNLNDTQGWGAYVSTNNSFILNAAKTIKAEINFWYQFPRFSDIYETKASKSLDLAFKMTFPKDSFYIGLVLQDILKTDIENGNTISGKTKYSYSDYFDSRSFRISLTYKFGKKNLNLKKRDFGNKEEKRRIN